MRWIVMPELIVTNPKTSSPLIGLQHLASLYWIFEMSSSITSASCGAAFSCVPCSAAFWRSISAAAARRSRFPVIGHDQDDVVGPEELLPTRG